MIFVSVVSVLMVSTMASAGESTGLFQHQDLVIVEGLNATEYNGCAGIIIPSDNPLDDVNPERYGVLINKVKQIPDGLASRQLPDPAGYLARRIVLSLPFGKPSDFAAFRIKPSNLRKIKEGTQEINKNELIWFYYFLNKLALDATGDIDYSDYLTRIKIIGAQIYDKYGTHGLHEIMNMNPALALPLSFAWQKCNFEGFSPLPMPFFQPN